MKFVKIPFVVQDVEIRQLQNDEIIQALHLLYNVYVEEQGWIPPASNKSGLEVREDAEGKFLYDSFVEHATWFGAWYKGDLVGCFRVLLPPYSELAEYIKLPESLTCAPASELNRLAFVKKWRGKQAVLLALLRVAFDYAYLFGPIVYTTGEKGKYSKLYQRLGIFRCDYPSFKYDKSDPQPVDILYYDARASSHYTTMLYQLTNHLAAEKRRA